MPGKPVVVIVGTRPEAIKMAPVVRALRRAAGAETVLLSTGQHRELLDSALAPFGLAPDHELAVMAEGQTPNDVIARVVDRLPPLLERLAPAAVLVQGDTTTVLAAALAAFHLGIPVGHVEAGLRTHDLANPFPEEANRQLTDRLATWCFAPTARSAANLRREGIPEKRISITGNTAVDALLWMLELHRLSPADARPELLITLHRRESFGGALRQILLGVQDFLGATPGATALWPIHPNPTVRRTAAEVFAGDPRIRLLEPLPFAEFVALLARVRVVLTDSGGIQEEAPSLGKAVLVARETTERPEGLDAGNRLIGRRREDVRAALASAWATSVVPERWPLPNPFGDGHAGERIVEILVRDLGRNGG